MSHKHIPTIDKIGLYEQNLFATEDEMRRRGVGTMIRIRTLRLRTLYAFWQNHPMMANKEIVAEDMRLHPEIKLREAYEDVKIIKYLIGNLEKESKEWHRYVFNSNIRKIFDKAMEDGDLKTAERALSDYAKYNRLDENDPQPIDYDQIKPHEILPTTDPTVIGIEAAPDLRERIERLRKRFAQDAEEAETVEEL